jgi:hypothetical protein
MGMSGRAVISGGTARISRGGSAAWNIIGLSCLFAQMPKRMPAVRRAFDFLEPGLAFLVLRLLAIAILLLRRILLLVVQGVSPCSPRSPE